MKPKRNYKPGTIDDCQTPPCAIYPLIPLPKKFTTIWECACGEGFLMNFMREIGLHVIGTDIKFGHDFFNYEPENWDCIITNPPFSLKVDWIARCYELDKPWALLLPVETIGTKGAQFLFKTRDPEIGIFYMDKRINFKMPNKGWDSHAQFPVAWYTWKFGFSGNRYFSFRKD